MLIAYNNAVLISKVSQAVAA